MFMEKAKFELQTFKTLPCPQSSLYHNLKQCIFYHSPQDQRRLCAYSSQKCEIENCENTNCGNAHNQTEQMYHEERFKTRFCSYYPNCLQECQYGAYCSFVHVEFEFRIKLLHLMKQDQEFYILWYKTVFCPFNVQHNRKSCVYAHNQQDFRRKLFQNERLQYQETDCPNWLKYQSIKSYEEGGCPNMHGCQFSHGWKEYDYHYNVYKTRKCNQKNCQEMNLCPFYHSALDKRDLADNKLKNRKNSQQMTLNWSFSTDCQENYNHSFDEDELKKENNYEEFYNLGQGRENIWTIELVDSLRKLDQIILDNEIKISTMRYSIQKN